MKLRAAIALYRLTGEADYHDVYLNMVESPDTVNMQPITAFAYTLLPDASADAALKSQSRKVVIDAADRALEFSEDNAFNLALASPLLPVMGYVAYYAAPETVTGATLPRAHYLTKDPKYLAAAVAASQFTAGANPMNMTLTTGLGINYPRAILHVDSIACGIAPPEGITVYGPGDPTLTGGAYDWAHTWALRGMTPNSRTWPTAEFYVDLPHWPPMTEYTVHQTLGNCAYYWGYLAAR
jgi:endoglucanase